MAISRAISYVYNIIMMILSLLLYYNKSRDLNQATLLGNVQADLMWSSLPKATREAR